MLESSFLAAQLSTSWLLKQISIKIILRAIRRQPFGLQHWSQSRIKRKCNMRGARRRSVLHMMRNNESSVTKLILRSFGADSSQQLTEKLEWKAIMQCECECLFSFVTNDCMQVIATYCLRTVVELRINTFMLADEFSKWSFSYAAETNLKFCLRKFYRLEFWEPGLCLLQSTRLAWENELLT